MDLDLWIRLLQYGEFLGLPETLAAFRIGQESLSADNEATIYAEQKAYIEELGATPHLQVRRIGPAARAGCARRWGGCAAARCSACPAGRPAATSGWRTPTPEPVAILSDGPGRSALVSHIFCS